MTQEHKELLLKDLSSRLPYGVKISVNDKVETLQGIDILDNVVEYDSFLSSMTEEQKKEYHNLCSVGTDECGDIIYFDTYESIDYLNKNKFDYRYIIPMGLAENATRLNIY